MMMIYNGGVSVYIRMSKSHRNQQRNFLSSKNWRFFLMFNYFENLSCCTISLDFKTIFPCSREFVIFAVTRHFPYSKNLVFLLFPDTFGKGWKVCGFWTETSAAGGRRGLCNCIRAKILSRPVGHRPARA